MPQLMYQVSTFALNAEAVSLDFSDALTTALNSIKGDFGKYAAIAIGAGLAIWGAPKAIKLVMKFFSALTH